MGENQRAANLFLAYIDLARMRIGVMVMVSCAIGFILAYHGQFPVDHFIASLVGTGLLSGGACALNCYIERDLDALMPRTSQRPIPAGVISPQNALAYGLSLLVLGSVLLFSINMLSGFLGMMAFLIYLLLYTPAKRVTWLNTSIGALPGAIPPLIGWAAAEGQISLGGWILFAMLFVWQHTHFFPIAWLFRNDYEQAGFQMLPVLESKGEKTFFLTVLTALILLPTSMLLTGANLAGPAYEFGSVIFGILLIVASLRLSQRPSKGAALSVLFLSICYLPVLLAAVLLDRYGTNLYEWLGRLLRWT